jgi:TrpR-related protein YerC/YecD
MSEDRVRTPEVEALLEAFLALKTSDEVYAFLQDVCTIREIQEMAQRLAVARMLAAGEHYSRIQEATGASSTTISRVSRCLNYGADGYRIVLERLSAEKGE